MLDYFPTVGTIIVDGEVDGREVFKSANDMGNVARFDLEAVPLHGTAVRMCAKHGGKKQDDGEFHFN